MINWCNRLRIAIIIGCLNLVAYLMVGVVIIENIKYDRYSHYDYDDYHDVYQSFDRREQARLHREFYCKIYVSVCAIMVLLSGLLVWGVIKKRPRFISPWLLMSFVVLIYSTIVILEDVFMKASFQGVANAAVFFVIIFVIYSLQICCLAVVYSVYTNLELNILVQRLRKETIDKVDDRLENHGQEENISNEKRSPNVNSNVKREAYQRKSKTKKLKPNKGELMKPK